MRFVIYLLSISALYGNSFSQDEPEAKPVALSWHTEEKAAKEDAANQAKPILLFFTADWCHFCHTMEDETFNTPAVSKYLSENFILLKADHDTEKDLVARYRVRGVPALVIGGPELEAVEQTSGHMPIDVFMAWAEMSAEKVSPEALAAAKAAANQFITDMSLTFRQGLVEDQYSAIYDFFDKYVEEDPKALAFAKQQLTEEVKHNPNRFCRFLKHEKLHVRILMTNAFATIYGKDFDYDPWELTTENYARLEGFLEKKGISSLLEDLIDF